MPGSNRSRTIIAVASFLLLSLLATSGHTQILLDLPAQPLGQALTAVGALGHLNVMFDPSIVDGLRAPKLKGDLNAEDAVSKLLSGTKLHVVRVDANTIRVIAVPAPRGAQSVGSAPSGSTYSTTALRLAEAGTIGPPGPADDSPGQVLEAESASEKNTSQSPQILEQIVVTGTHIRGAQPSSPFTMISSDDIAKSGYTNIGDFMRTLPQNSAAGASPQTLTGSGPVGAGANNLSAGSAPNLRGLGAGSTLTLVNGHRLAQDSQAGAVDITQIPIDAIDRVEVVPDGASATYGSDAVAGVVNFILKNSYDGSQTSASYGNSTQGGGRDWRVSELIGKSWANGGVVVDYEHEDQDSIDASQRSFTSTVATPYSLMPATRRDSVFASLHQDFSNLEAYVDGLYTSREADFYQTYPPTYHLPSPVKSYDVTGGLKYSLLGSWQLSAFGSYGKQSSNYTDFIVGEQPPFFVEYFSGTTRTAEIDADGHLVELPTGPARIAIGGGNRVETYSDGYSTGATLVNASRHINYAFVELNVPLLPPSERPWLRELNLEVAGRYEDYSDFGHKSVPKVGLVYVPFKELKVHASASRSFRAPTLTAVYQLQSAFLLDIPDPESTAPTGLSQVIIANGGRSSLQPETATTETVGFDFSPTWVDGLFVSPTYFHIDYKNRIGTINNGYLALTDPNNARFVTRDPSLALQQSIVSAAQAQLGFNNYSAESYDPATLAALVDTRQINIAQQTLKGLDLLISYSRTTDVGFIKAFLNGTYMDMHEQGTPSAPVLSRAGTAFSPPRVRARAGASWVLGAWTATGTVNYTGHETNTFQADRPEISSWTTVDAQIAYSLPRAGRLDGVRISLSVLNLFDKDPPFVDFNVSRQGFNYDVVNANPVGRYVTVQAAVPVSW